MSCPVLAAAGGRSPRTPCEADLTFPHIAPQRGSPFAGGGRRAGGPRRLRRPPLRRRPCPHRRELRRIRPRPLPTALQPHHQSLQLAWRCRPAAGWHASHAPRPLSPQEGLREVAIFLGPRLKSLSLAHSPLDDAHLRVLAVDFRALQHLDLSHCSSVRLPPPPSRGARRAGDAPRSRSPCGRRRRSCRTRGSSPSQRAAGTRCVRWTSRTAPS